MVRSIDDALPIREEICPLSYIFKSVFCFHFTELITLDPIELATGMYKKDILDKLGSKDVSFP